MSVKKRRESWRRSENGPQDSGLARRLDAVLGRAAMRWERLGEVQGELIRPSGGASSQPPSLVAA